MVFHRSWIWPALIAVAIVLASSRSQVAAPHVPGIDKFAHFGVYGLFATLLCRLGRGWQAAGWALLGASIFGVTDEWHQSFVPGRSVEVADWAADTAGAALGVTLYAGFEAYRRLLETPLGWRPRLFDEPASASHR